ncbi:MAG: TetR/AcrR family transcriptional regulator [Bacteroidales bacterium]|jgi:AcrR family transcriptional regulator|nr:TetR/AcrR family transcriptional regulator [Bacteroidales bacterium]
MEIKDKLTEEKIFEAATQVFLAKGMDGARMQDIADIAGINKSLLHYYFRSKDKLFDAVFEKLAKTLFSKFIPVLSPDLTLEDKVRFFFREHIAFLQQNSALPLFVLNEINRKPARVQKFLENIDVKLFWETVKKQHGTELGGNALSIDSIVQITSTIISISIFPFVACGILEGVLKKVNLQFDDYFEMRKEFAAEFVIGALKSMNLNSQSTIASGSEHENSEKVTQYNK